MSNAEQKKQDFMELQNQAIRLCDEDAFRKMVEAWRDGQADVWQRTFASIDEVRGKALALFKTFPPRALLPFHMKEDDAMLAAYNQELRQNDLRYVQIFVEVMGRQPNIMEVEALIKRSSQYFMATNKVSSRVQAMDLEEER